MNHCLFCNIAAGKMNTEFVYEDDRAVAFHDIHPQAPTHVLVIPKKHYVSLKDMDDPALMGHLMDVVRKTAEKLGLEYYRVVANTGAKAGQSVFHLHIHILSGRSLNWPPG